MTTRSQTKYMRKMFNPLAAFVGISLTLFGLTASSQGFSVGGVEFADFLLLDVAPGSDFQLSTTGDIYVWVPSPGLFSSSLDFRAKQDLIVDCPVNASSDIWFSTGPRANIDNAPTLFQDVVLRVTGTVGTLNLDSAGSIVVDAVPVPEPWPLSVVSLGLGWVIVDRRRKYGGGSAHDTGLAGEVTNRPVRAFRERT